MPKDFNSLKQLVISNLKGSIRGLLNKRGLKIVENEVREFFSYSGEDAFVQWYFNRKAWKYLNCQYPKNGFYVDVGSFHPINISNTYWFYKKGWRGINIDANPQTKELFDNKRPQDINLHVAISDEEKELVFYSWGESPLNTLSEDLVKKYIQEKKRQPNEIKLKTIRLDSILDRYLPANQEISFFSVDVEGHDLEVLKSNNWDKYRPELVLVEELNDDIHQLINSPIANLMKDMDYAMIAWTPPTVIYVNKRSVMEPFWI
jgi:FkbM family methyltransferase